MQLPGVSCSRTSTGPPEAPWPLDPGVPCSSTWVMVQRRPESMLAVITTRKPTMLKWLSPYTSSSSPQEMMPTMPARLQLGLHGLLLSQQDMQLDEREQRRKSARSCTACPICNFGLCIVDGQGRGQVTSMHHLDVYDAYTISAWKTRHPEHSASMIYTIPNLLYTTPKHDTCNALIWLGKPVKESNVAQKPFELQAESVQQQQHRQNQCSNNSTGQQEFSTKCYSRSRIKQLSSMQFHNYNQYVRLLTFQCPTRRQIPADTPGLWTCTWCRS